MAQPHFDTDQIVKRTFVARAEYHRTLSSTNDRARQCAAEGGGALPLLVVADRQTAGRGRGDHRWWTGPDSLALSLLLDPGEAVRQPQGGSPLVALAAAVAVVETVAPVVRSHRVGIDWPNDVMVDEGKLAGVLVEVLPDRRQIVGIGLNTNNSLAQAPPDLKQTATTLLELTGVTHDQAAILMTLLERLEDRLGLLVSDPARIGARADDLCLQHGKTLTLCTGNQSIIGRCVGIAADGALLLGTPDGRRAFYSGMLQ